MDLNVNLIDLLLLWAPTVLGLCGKLNRALTTHTKFAGRARLSPEPEETARFMEEENLNTHTLIKRKENRMSIYKNSGVIEAWDHNEAARNHRNTLHTDGKNVSLSTRCLQCHCARMSHLCIFVTPLYFCAKNLIQKHYQLS